LLRANVESPVSLSHFLSDVVARFRERMPKITWYFQRVRAMGPMELLWRVWRLGRARAEALRPWQEARSTDLGVIWNGCFCTAELIRLNPAFPVCPVAEQLATWPPEWRARCLADADAAVAHRADFFMLRGRELGESIDWHCDYASGLQIPLVYSGCLDYRDARRVGDVKVTWEMGRMGQLARLGQAWRWTRDDRYAREIVGQIKSWIEGNPWMRGIHWTSPMECALRLIVWTWSFHLIRDWEGLKDDFCRLFVASIYQHLVFIDRNYSLFSSANNHLITEASGVYIAAAYWRGLKGSAHWARRARSHLLRECLRQNTSDGVNREQTFPYQFFVWDLLVLPALFARASNEDFPPLYWERLERMAEFMAWVSDGEGNTPNIGDEDEGIAIRLGGDKEKPVRNMLGLAAALFGRGEFLSRAGHDAGERAAWLVPQKLPKPIDGAWSSRSFPEGGYHVIRSAVEVKREFFLVFDVGPNGDRVTGAHGHADGLSVVLHLGGQPFLADPGTFSYQDTPSRRYFRSTLRHNTLCFGEDDQSEYLNRFLWGRRAEVELDEANLSWMEGVVAGRVRWWTGATHYRRIEYDFGASTVCLRDQWNGGIAPILNFTLAPQITVELLGDRCARLVGSHASLLLKSTLGRFEVQEMAFSSRCYEQELTHALRLQLPYVQGETTTTLTWEWI
jgi:hypothetical protein